MVGVWKSARACSECSANEQLGTKFSFLVPGTLIFRRKINFMLPIMFFIFFAYVSEDSN